MEEIKRLTGDSVDAVFGGIGGKNVWRSFNALRPGGKVVAFGFTSSLRKGRVAGGIRYRFRGMAMIVFYMLASLFRPGRRKIGVYSIQRRMWARQDDFRTDLTMLFELLNERKIKPLIAARLPLADARKAHEMLADGGVKGKLILLCGALLANESEAVVCGC